MRTMMQWEIDEAPPPDSEHAARVEPSKNLVLKTANGLDPYSKEYQMLFDDLWAIEEDFIERDELLKQEMDPRVRKLLLRTSCVAQRTPEWFRQRAGKLTGSVIAAAIGQDKYKSRAKLMREKLGEEPRFEGNVCTQRGIQLEPHAAVAYQRKTGLKLIPFDLGLMPHLQHDEIAGSCDGVTFCGILIEIKCPWRRPIIEGKVPSNYLPQIQSLLEIHELEMAHFVDYRPAENGLPELCAVTEVKRDRAWFKRNFPLMRSFVHEMRAKLKYKKENPPRVLQLDIWGNEPKPKPKRKRKRSPTKAEKVVGYPFIM
jgi:putative phage-type endonuclease